MVATIAQFESDSERIFALESIKAAVLEHMVCGDFYSPDDPNCQDSICDEEEIALDYLVGTGDLVHYPPTDELPWNYYRMTEEKILEHKHLIPENYQIFFQGSDHFITRNGIVPWKSKQLGTTSSTSHSMDPERTE